MTTPGTYTVRVEATNGLGTRVIGETTATVERGVQHAGIRNLRGAGRYVPSQRRADDQLRHFAVSCTPAPSGSGQ